MSELPMIAPGYEDREPPDQDLSGCLSNLCVIDSAVLTEAMRAAMNRPFFRLLRIAELLLAALFLAGLIWAAVTSQGLGTLLWYAFLLLMLGFFFIQQFIWYPKRAVKNQLRRQALEDGAAALTNRLWFTEENVANRRGEGDQLLHMDYDRIKRVSETPRLIVLTTRANRLIPLDKAGFENGGPEDLLKLLERKCPRIKRVRR